MSLVIGSQTTNLIPDHFLGHKPMNFRSPNGKCKPISNIDISQKIQWYKEGPIGTRFVIYAFGPKIENSCGGPMFKGRIRVGMLVFISLHSPTIVGMCLNLGTLSHFTSFSMPLTLVMSSMIAL